MTRIDSVSESSIDHERSSEALTFSNRAGMCRADLQTGLIEFRPATGAAGGPLVAMPAVGMARGRLDAGAATTAITWQNREGGPGVRVVELRRVIGHNGALLLWRIAVRPSHYEVQVGLAGATRGLRELRLEFDSRYASTLQQPRLLKVAYCGAHSKSELSRSEIVAIGGGTRARSWWVTSIFDYVSSFGFVLGFVSATRMLGRFELDDKSLAAVSQVEPSVASEAVTWSEPLYVAAAGRVQDELVRYADRVAEVCGPRGGSSVFGWGSWTNYRDAIHESDVRQNASVIAGWPRIGPGRPLVHVDHGWEKRFTAHRPEPRWTPRPAFTSDIRALGGRLHRDGLRFGLWVVPFAVNADKAVPPELRAAVIADERGEPVPLVGTQCYAIDPTKRAGEQWLRSLFSQLRDWGVTYYKLDFLRVLLGNDPVEGLVAEARFFQPEMTRIAAYRRGLEIIRETVGNDAHLLGCGAPLLPSAGVIDSCRIGSDIEPVWHDGHSGIAACSRNVTCNFFWHRRVWDNDPDFVVVPPELHLFRFWMIAVALSGGPVLASTDLAALSRARRAQLKRFVPPFGHAAVPLAFDADGPGTCQILSVAAHGETYEIVGLFNRSLRTRRYSLDVAELGIVDGATCVAWDVWNSRAVGRPGTRWTVAVGRHDARLICVRRLSDRPQLLATSAHFSMGAMDISELVWDATSQTMRCDFLVGMTPPSRLYFSVPKLFSNFAVEGGTIRWRNPILIVDVTNASKSVVLRFKPMSYESCC